VANATPDAGKAPLGVLFSSAGTADGDGTIVGYSWDFGDGSPASTEVDPAHTYTSQGVFTATLTVTDDKGGTDTAEVVVTVSPTNVAPSVNISATPTFGKAPVSVDFTSSTSDSDGTVTGIVWDFGDGSPTSTDPNPSHVYAAGVWTATLTATDDDGATTTRSIEIRSLPNLPPTAHAAATPSNGRAPLLVQLSSSGSVDFDGTITGYEWDFGDGSPTSTAANPTHTYAAGTWTATLTVTDDEGATGTATVTVQSTVNQAPTAVANATPDGTKAPLAVDFSSGGSVDHDGTIVSYKWDFGDGSPVSTEANPTHTYLTDGTFAATLTVTDNEGATDVKSVTVQVGPPNVAPVPVATATPSSGRAPLEVQLSSAGSSDSDGMISTYRWDFGDGSEPVNTPDAQHTYGPGTWTATLTVTDDDGASATMPVTIESTVNQAPTAAATATPSSGTAPLEVAFDSSGSTDADGTIVSWFWEFGDGATSVEPNPTHQYAAGTYVATLHVTDDEGGTASTTVPVRSNAGPTAVASADVTSGDGPLTVTFTGSGSLDPDGSIVSYQWDFGDGDASTEADPTHTYSPGIHTATLTVTDDEGATATATVTIDVNSRPTSSVSADVTSGAAPLTVHFTGTADDSDGTFGFSWDFGDGSPPVTDDFAPAHTYTDAGSYEVTLTVTDDRGAVTVSAPVTITVT
jgi:PKD repeat protein